MKRTPAALNRIVDVVLAYRPKSKMKKRPKARISRKTVKSKKRG